jgi:hypothetical protein
MTKKQASPCERLKQMGFRQENQMRLYGKIFEFRGNPVVLEDNLVVMEAIERRSGRLSRVHLPLPIVNMASGGRSAV